MPEDKNPCLPLDLEALAVGAGLQAFMPHFKESGCKPIIYSDSTPVVMAYNKMLKGQFSASPRVATFLHEVLNSGAIIKYLSGKSNAAADFNSRNAAACKDPDKCQVCSWVADNENMVVRRMTAKNVESILAGNDPLPFKSKGYWAKRQREDPVLQKVARCISKGITPPSTKANG